MVVCRLCAHRCRLRPGGRGRCAVRINAGGILRTLAGNRLISVCVDPVEKKPLYHYLPGSRTLSMGSMGCNFSCTFCQNADISHFPAQTGEVRGESWSAEQVCEAAVANGCRSLAFTYNEPTLFYEFLTAASDLAHDSGLGTILVSNGFQSADCLAALRNRISAANIDLKAFSEEFYRTRCGGRLAPVLDNLKRMTDMGWWLEVTTLFIPGLNDSPEEMHAIARFIRQSLGAHVPWHCTAFHPCHELRDRPPTPDGTLLRACRAGEEEGLLFVYPGNAAVSRPTRCPSCGKVFIAREGWNLRKSSLDGTCAACGTAVPGIW